MPTYILGIESSCDDTSASVLCDGKVLSNLIANQEIHKSFGGVVPELASRAHQQNIIPVVNQAILNANIDKNQLNAIAYTRGPGLLGSLLVGSSFSLLKGNAPPVNGKYPGTFSSISHLRISPWSSNLGNETRGIRLPDKV